MNNHTNQRTEIVSLASQDRSIMSVIMPELRLLLVVLSFVCSVLALYGCASSPKPPDSSLHVYLTANHDRFWLSVKPMPSVSTTETIEVTNPIVVPVTITSITFNDVCNNNGIVLDYPNMTCLGAGDPRTGATISRTLQPGEKCTVSLRWSGAGRIFADGKLSIWGSTNVTTESKEILTLDVLLSSQ